MPQTTKFNGGISPRLAASIPQTRIEIFEPTLGFDSSQPAVDLKPGQSPDLTNFVTEEGFLVPRSGLSNMGNASLGANEGLLAYEHIDVNGDRHRVIGSTRTLSVFTADAVSWSTLSYVVRGTGLPADNLSGNTFNHMMTASVYDPTSDQNWLVVSNGTNTPKAWIPSQTTFSDISDFISVDSVGRYPFSISNRLCFFNCGSRNTVFATRVRWSERGVPSNWSTIGAGFEDLMDMRGEGTGAIVRENDVVLFSSEEVWIARPRLDAYVFDFFPLDRSVGCPYPRTITNTPQGIVFLTREFEPYLVNGSSVVPAGSQVHPEIRNSIVNADFAFGVYNSRFQRYEFYYMTQGQTNRPSQALYLDFNNGAWSRQSFGAFEFASGYEATRRESEFAYLIGEVDDTIGSVGTQIGQMLRPGGRSQYRDTMLVSSRGTPYRLRSEQSTDDGTAVTAYWTSHALSGEDPTQSQSLSQLWIDYESNITSALSVRARGFPQGDYGTASNVTLTRSSAGSTQYVPMFVTGPHPQFEISLRDGSRPRIARFVAKIRQAGQF